MEYQNQKPLQTLVGNLVQPGTTFSVSAASVTMDEGTTTNLTAQAGGAAKVYWLLKQNGLETVIAADQFTYTHRPGRVTGNQSFVIQFKAVYPNGTIQTDDIPVTVLDTIPDPVFTLVPSTNLWDGRTDHDRDAGHFQLGGLAGGRGRQPNYNWSVAGVAVTVQNPPASQPGHLHQLYPDLAALAGQRPDDRDAGAGQRRSADHEYNHRHRAGTRERCLGATHAGRHRKAGEQPVLRP